jgi:hypothetical protein
MILLCAATEKTRAVRCPEAILNQKLEALSVSLRWALPNTRRAINANTILSTIHCELALHWGSWHKISILPMRRGP